MVGKGGQGGASGPDATAAPGYPSTDVVEVMLVDAPIPMIVHEQLRHRDLVREFALMRIGASEDDSAAAHVELLELLDALDEYQGSGNDMAQLIEQHFLNGTEKATLIYATPRAVGPVLERLSAVYEKVDAFTRNDGHLLTLPPSPTASRMRQWFFGELVGQLAGKAPTPWDGPSR